VNKLSGSKFCNSGLKQVGCDEISHASCETLPYLQICTRHKKNSIILLCKAVRTMKIEWLGKVDSTPASYWELLSRNLVLGTDSVYWYSTPPSTSFAIHYSLPYHSMLYCLTHWQRMTRNSCFLSVTTARAVREMSLCLCSAKWARCPFAGYRWRGALCLRFAVCVIGAH
jgi:hypothetical protein